MRILVTGGAGFIGSHVAERLLCAGHEVIVADDLSTGAPGNLPCGVDLHRLSLLDGDLAAVCAGADAVVHAAAQTSVAASVQDPAGDAATNILGTVRLLEAAGRAGAGRFLFISSAAVYGQGAEPPVTEACPLLPSSPYGLSKLVGERYVRLLCELSGMDWAILRLANVYGPRQSAAGEAGVIARWCAALAGGRPALLQGDGSQTRDFIYVADVADAVALAVAAPGAAGRVLNIGTEMETPIRAVLGCLQQLLGREGEPLRVPLRSGDIARSALATGAAREALGWVPATPLAEGLARTAAWAAAGGAGGEGGKGHGP
jgi:UDP-glucose 4-epimerase